MVVVSSREFRANQRKYFDLARTNDVVITSRAHGSYRLVPVTEEDTVMTKEELYQRIDKGIREIREGKGYRVTTKEELERYLDSL